MTKSKKQTKVKEINLPKNPADYSYDGDEILPLKATTFFILLQAIDKAIKRGSKLYYPVQEDFISTLDGSKVENPTNEQLKSGEVRPVVSVEKTFAPENLKEEFEEWIMPEIATAKEELLKLHAEAVKQGIAKFRGSLKSNEQSNQ